MASADLFVGPSVVDRFGDTEGQGVVFVEAMASGCPVVATTVGGVPDVITSGETGLLVPPNDSDALAGAIIDSLKDRENTGRRIKAALVHIRKYDWARIAEGFEALFKSLTSQTSTSPDP
jgi:glycosyltransferase involved in cell wall biosynthesis